MHHVKKQREIKEELRAGARPQWPQTKDWDTTSTKWAIADPRPSPGHMCGVSRGQRAEAGGTERGFVQPCQHRLKQD
ncbi:hypothetical protein MHYP_G00174080 [Metynnis hypsauchen]